MRWAANGQVGFDGMQTRCSVGLPRWWGGSYKLNQTPIGSAVLPPTLVGGDCVEQHSGQWLSNLHVSGWTGLLIKNAASSDRTKKF